QVNGRDLPLETPPFIEAGTTYVPLRFIAESMHARVGYEASTNPATVDLDAAQTQPTPTAGELGTLRPVPSNWFIPGTKMH
ncbi:copper amine oxidase N-terminal domain-containing protein, partial [Acinetobacter baumannii]